MKLLKNLCDMSGRVSLVTGGAGHIGRVIGQTLAELGSEIIILDLSLDAAQQCADEISKEFGVKTYALEVDLEDIEAVLNVGDWVENNAGRLDIIVNNAALAGTSALEGWCTSFENQSIETWKRALDVNVTAPFALVQSCQSLLSKHNCGSIINISSIYGDLGPDMSLYSETAMGNPAAYGVSKSGMNQLTKWLSTVMAPAVRVNTLSLGGVWRNQPEVFVEKFIRRTPLKRMAVEEDFKGAIAYFATDLSRYTTGQNLFIDGGFSAW